MFPQHLGDYVDLEFIHAASVTAGGGGDDSEVNGDSIDRQDFYSAVLGIPLEATLAEDETATLAVTIQESADGSAWADADDGYQPDNVVLTGDTGGSTETGIMEHDLDLKGLERYIRAQITLTFSAAETDTGAYGANIALGGSVKKPV